jgi:hypothetical protein
LGYYKALGISLEEAGAAVGDRWLAHLQPLLCTLQMCSKAQLTHTGYKRLFVARCSHKLLAPLLQSVLSDAIDELDQPLLPQLPPLSCCSHHSALVLAQQHTIVNVLSLVHALACLGYDSVLHLSKHVGVSISLDHIKSHYKAAALKLHPDKHVHSDEATQRRQAERFRRLQLAYETLRDPEKRRAYDQGRLVQ